MLFDLRRCRFAYDTPELIAAFSIWLGTSTVATKFKGGYMHVTWDVEELEKHADEIIEKRLLKTRLTSEGFGPGGYKFEK
jgi:hypothetical protein